MARTSKIKKNKKNCRPHVHRVRQEPQWGLQFWFVFFGFSRFLHGLLQMARTSKNQKKAKKTKLQTTCPQCQTRAPMGSAVLFFLIFEVFAWSAPDGQNLEKSKKSKKNKTADHMSTVSDKSPNGVCSFVFLFVFDFRSFCMVCSRWPEQRKSKKT